MSVLYHPCYFVFIVYSLENQRNTFVTDVLPSMHCMLFMNRCLWNGMIISANRNALFFSCWQDDVIRNSHNWQDIQGYYWL